VNSTIALPRPAILEPKLEGIPRELKTYPSWVVWRLEVRENGRSEPKWTKAPYSSLSGSRASHSDSRTWCPFPDALLAYQEGGYDGIGYVFSSGCPFTGVDIDGCRDLETGELNPLAQEIIGMFPRAYAELSASGTGVHLIVRGRAPRPVKNDASGVEVYSMLRFFTITGIGLESDD